MCSVQKNYGKPAHLAGTLAVACLLLASASFGQEEGQRKPDKQILRKLSEWVGIFTLYSDVDLSDRVDLKEYSEAADLASAFLTNPELSAHIAEFKAATFVNVYPLGLVNHPEWLFRKLNDISKAQYSTLNAPHVMVEVQFTPADNFTGYLITLVFKGNDPLKDEWIRLANQQAGISLAAQKFASPLQAKDKVNAAIVAGLDALKASIGNTFMPNLAIRCNDETFLNNQVIELWQRADSTGVVLQAVTGEGTPITSLLTWTGARKREGQSAVFLPTQAGDVPVSVQRGTEKITVRMRVKEFSIDLNQLLKKLIVEAISQKRQQAATRLLELRQDSVANAVAIRNLLAQIEQGNFPMEATGNTLFPVFTNPVTLTDSSAFRDASLPRTANLRELKKRQRLHHNIRRNLNVEALADLLVNNPSQLDSLLNQLVRSSGQLIARLIVGKDRQGQENVARDIVVDYVNEHLKQLTDVLPQEAEKPLPTPASTGTTAAFNANQWVYANPLLPINNLSNFINNLADSARKRNTYVFIHYSQDVSTDAYLLRAPQAVPRGLPPGARFVTVTLVNIPGSVNYMLLGSKGRVPGSGGQNQEEEIWRYLLEDDEDGAMVAAGSERFPDAAVPCTTAQIAKLQQDFEARLAGKKFRIYGGGMEMYGFDEYKLETGHKEILTKAGICDLAQFDAKLKHVLHDPSHDIVRDVDIIYSTVNLWEGLTAGYNDGSVDWESFIVPKITNRAELDNELNRLEAVAALAKEVLPSGVVSENSYSNIANYIKTCREQPAIALEDKNKIHLNQTIKGIYVGLHCYANYTYSFSDLKVRPAIKASRTMWPDVEKAEQEGYAVPLSVSNSYTQYLAQYNTDKAYFLGEQYLVNVFLIEMLRGMKYMFANLGTAWRTAINKQARLKMQVRRTELDALKGQVRKIETPGVDKLWTSIGELTGNFQGKVATYYDVNVTYQSSRVRAGVAFAQNGILEFHLKIPDQLQGQGIGSEIFKRAISDYSPSKVKGWWKQSDIYTGGESINLKIFREKITSGMKPIDAAFETPTGKILKENGFDGVPEIIRNTPEEVIIHFNHR
jgi:hypothetical protein